MVKKTRHELETELSRAMSHFEKDYFGRGPIDVHTFIIQDMLLVRMYSILTPAEQALAGSREGMFQIKDIRRQLFETSRPLLEELVRQTTGHRVVSMHTDLSTSSGERIVIFIVDVNLETVFPA